jgi:hypothetical protein
MKNHGPQVFTLSDSLPGFSDVASQVESLPEVTNVEGCSTIGSLPQIPPLCWVSAMERVLTGSTGPSTPGTATPPVRQDEQLVVEGTESSKMSKWRKCSKTESSVKAGAWRMPQDKRIEAIVKDVADHYDVPVCSVAIECQDGLLYQGLEGPLDISQWPACSPAASTRRGCLKDEFKFFHYNVNRRLPLVIYDVSKDDRLSQHSYASDSQVPMGFYASAPLILPDSMSADGKESPMSYIGCLCIADTKPRFPSMADCEFLTKQAQMITKVLSEKM